MKVTVCDINHPDQCREVTLDGGLPAAQEKPVRN